MTLPFNLLPQFQQRVMTEAAKLAIDSGLDVHLVGGAVRDLLLARPTRDLDFTLPEGADGFVHALAARLGGKVDVFPSFRTFKIEPPGEAVIDVTTTRSERYPSPGALPVVGDGTLLDDMLRRDFSINAISCRLRDGALIDLVGGVTDLRAGVLRVLHDASFTDDPTRMFRAVRLAARLGMTLDSPTAAGLEAAVRHGALSTVSQHRLWREIMLAFAEERPVAALRALSRFGLLPFPIEGSGEKDGEIEARANAFPDERELILAGYLVTPLIDVERAFAGSDWNEQKKRELQRVSDRKQVLGAQLRAAPTPADRYAVLRGQPAALLHIARVTEADQKEVIDRYLEAAGAPISFRHAPLSVPSGPHMGRAIADTRMALFAGTITPEEADTFACAAAIRYFSERERA